MWKPLSSAPKDGSLILIYGDCHGYGKLDYEIAYFLDIKNKFVLRDNQAIYVPPTVMWRELDL